MEFLANNKVFERVGLAVSAFYGLRVVHWFFVHFIASNNLSKYGAKKNGKATAWALVTGASEGIGFAMAKEMAKRGLNVVIVSRSVKSLEAASAAIRQTNPHVQVEFCAADCSKYVTALEKIKKTMDGKKISVLVNNVGVETGDPQPFVEKSVWDADMQVLVNCQFSTQCTLAFLPDIVKNAKEMSLRGAVINLSSNASVLDTPLLTTYTACKAFNRAFSNTLAGECKALYPGLIDVLCCRPSFVESKMSGLVANSTKGKLIGVITAERFAIDALSKLGHVFDISPNWNHDMMGNLLVWLPNALSQPFMYFMTNLRYQRMKEGKKD